MLRKPTLIIGDVHFSSLKEGFVHCPDITKLAMAIKEAILTPPATDNTLITYIASIIKNITCNYILIYICYSCRVNDITTSSVSF